MENWKDYIKLPLERHKTVPFWIVDSNGTHVLDCFLSEEETDYVLMHILTGEGMQRFLKVREGHPCDIRQEDGKPFIRIRAWGHLTGIGALHLPVEKAMEIQNGFRDFIIEQLTKK